MQAFLQTQLMSCLDLLNLSRIKEYFRFKQKRVGWLINSICKRKLISDLENQADELKAETRSLLPKSIIFCCSKGRYIGSNKIS